MVKTLNPECKSDVPTDQLNDNWVSKHAAPKIHVEKFQQREIAAWGALSQNLISVVSTFMTSRDREPPSGISNSRELLS